MVGGGERSRGVYMWGQVTFIGSPQKYILIEMQEGEVGGVLEVQGLLSATLERSSSKTRRGRCLVGFW